MNKAIKFIFYATLFTVAVFMSFQAGRNAPDILRQFGSENVHAGGLSGGDDNFDLLFEAKSIVGRHYLKKLDTDEDYTKMEYGAIRGMLRSLGDQYTRFMDPKAYTNMTIETKGEFGGVGIVIGIRNEQLTVISPLEETPAFRAGLKSGDIIIKIDGVSTEDMALDDAVARIRGNAGDKVVLTVWRRSFDSVDGKDFEIIRDIIELKPINESRMIEDTGIGYLKLETFSKVSRDEMKKQILEFKEKGMKGLIFDLRYNPGGLLDSAVEVSQLFIEEGPIVHRENREGKLTTYYAKPGHKVVDVPTVVLVNQYSASASEIVSGALQDHGVATIMGEQTFGKGLVQTVYRMSDDSAILVTTDKYLTAKKRDINLKGITPDIVVTSETVDTHKAAAGGEEGEDHDPGKVGKLWYTELKGKNGVVLNGSPLMDIQYKPMDGKRYLEVDDVARIFNVSMRLDEASGILDIEKDAENLEGEKEDIQLKRATEYLQGIISPK